MMHRITCLGVLAIAAASPPASAAQELPRWTLSAEPVVQIGVVEGDPRYQLFDAVSSALLDDGRIAVLNAGSHELRFYGADGRFLAAVGRKGGGPGEFAAPGRLYRVGRDSLMIYDRGNTRFSIHTLDGTFVRTEPAVHNRLFAYDEWLYNRHWIDGPALGRGRAPVRAAVDRLPPPDPGTGFRYVKVSPQGHLWVRQPAQADGPVAWTVYDIDARPIARITTPPKFEIHEIGRDYLLGVGRDELDVEFIQLFRMHGAERAPARTLAAANGTHADDAPPSRAVPQEVLAPLRAAMKDLATWQEIHYSEAGSYTADLKRFARWEPPRGVTIRIVKATARGWTAVMIDDRTGATCGMSYALIPPVGWPSGAVVCE